MCMLTLHGLIIEYKQAGSVVIDLRGIVVRGVRVSAPPILCVSLRGLDAFRLSSHLEPSGVAIWGVHLELALESLPLLFRGQQRGAPRLGALLGGLLRAPLGDPRAPLRHADGDVELDVRRRHELGGGLGRGAGKRLRIVLGNPRAALRDAGGDVEGDVSGGRGGGGGRRGGRGLGGAPAGNPILCARNVVHSSRFAPEVVNPLLCVRNTAVRSDGSGRFDAHTCSPLRLPERGPASRNALASDGLV
mmetsp:Transcript_12109/g.20484  ORF Transcript_12109/g.20484 Transcript_12109/m.20484 type:complete len:247 (+) Transcript_12109:272-1012(+)